MITIKSYLRSMTLESAMEIIKNEDFLNHDGEYVILPGFADVHVHLREPGFSHKETIESGTKAAARGGYTAVCSMPNLNPTPDSVEHMKVQTELIEQNAVIPVYPYATITVGERGETLSDMEGLAPLAVAFSDDGRGVQNAELMKKAFAKAKTLGKMIVAHCEVNDLLFGGYIHDGEYAKKNNHKGICSKSEYAQIERDIEIAKEVGTPYHVCHISAKESVQAIRKAKADGIDITCETGPHYLVLDDSDLMEDGKFKMNPPLRDKSDKLELIKGIKDGTIDMIATDHAPHAENEKNKGLEKSAFGIVGLETAFPVLYTYLVKTGEITMEDLVKLLCDNPRKRFKIEGDEGLSVWRLDKKFTVNPEEFLSKGKATPFENKELYGVNIITVFDGKAVYKSNQQ